VEQFSYALHLPLPRHGVPHGAPSGEEQDEHEDPFHVVPKDRACDA